MISSSVTVNFTGTLTVRNTLEIDGAIYDIEKTTAAGEVPPSINVSHYGGRRKTIYGPLRKKDGVVSFALIVI